MNEHDKKLNEYFVDAVRYETADTALTGAQIKSRARIEPTYQLFLEEEGDKPDRLVSDGESVPLEDRIKHFFAVPPATFGAS
jgi:Multiubiquitin